MNRRNFLFLSAAGTPLIGSTLSHLQETSKKAPPPKLADDLVKTFVSAGHNDLPKVQQMLNDHPGLLNASWDLGGGDFETALEGAGHVGDREIAEYLIGQGARPNIFVLTMLGHTDVVLSLLKSFPALLRSRGPHGLTLLHHAERGGEAAAELVEELTGMGLTERKLRLP